MSMSQLQDAARKQATAFGICTLTAKRLKHSFCKTEAHEKVEDPPKTESASSDTDEDDESPVELGEGMETESEMEMATAEFEKVSARILNGPSKGAAMVDKMGRNDLLAFNKKSMTATALCQRSLLTMRKSCEHETDESREAQKDVKDYGRGGKHSAAGSFD